MLVGTWLVLCFFVGFVGKNKKIGYWGAFFLSLLLSPLIGLIIALVSKPFPVEENPEYLRHMRKYTENMTAKKYDLALVEIKEALKLAPSSPKAHYNAACYYSITGNENVAFNHLQRAVECGYSDYEKIGIDEDLAYLRSTDNWENFVRSGYRLL